MPRVASRFRIPAGRAAMLLASMASPGCLGEPIEPNQTAYEATLQPASGSTVRGSAAAVSNRQGRRTEASVNVMDGAADSVLHWRIRAGTCGGERGAVLGAASSYPELETDLSGSDSRTATLTQAMVGSESYMVEIWADATGDVVLACGALSRL